MSGKRLYPGDPAPEAGRVVDEDWFRFYYATADDLEPVAYEIHETTCLGHACGYRPDEPCPFHPPGCACSEGACQEGTPDHPLPDIREQLARLYSRDDLRVIAQDASSTIGALRDRERELVEALQGVLRTIDQNAATAKRHPSKAAYNASMAGRWQSVRRARELVGAEGGK